MFKNKSSAQLDKLVPSWIYLFEEENGFIWKPASFYSGSHQGCNTDLPFSLLTWIFLVSGDKEDKEGCTLLITLLFVLKLPFFLLSLLQTHLPCQVFREKKSNRCYVLSGTLALTGTTCNTCVWLALLVSEWEPVEKKEKKKKQHKNGIL